MWFKSISPPFYPGLNLFTVCLSAGIFLISCNKQSDTAVVAENYKFIIAYTANITVGGFVGVAERTFQVGETYTGTDEGKSHITLRISAHTKKNEDCPNPWCYQEFLEVPRSHLQRIP